MFDYSISFKAIDNVTRKINAINSKMAGMSNASKVGSTKITNNLSKMNLSATVKLNTVKALQSLTLLRSKMKRLGDAGKKMAISGIQSLVSGVALAGSLLLPLNIARKYELAFKDVKKAVSGTPEELEALHREMKAFSGASFEELSIITAEAGKMGFSADKVMQFSESVVKGAKALDFDAQLAVGQVGKILSLTNQMNTAVASGEDIMNKVVHLENNLSGVKGAGVIEVWSRSADTFAQLNFDNQQMAGISAFLEQTHVSSRLGASGFNILINRFQSMESELGFVERIKSKGIEGLRDVMAEIGKLTPQEQISKFGDQAVKMLRKLQGEDNLKKLEVAINISKSSEGAVLKEWEIFRGTFDERLKDTAKNFSNLMETIGAPMFEFASKVLGVINIVLTKFNDWASENKALSSTILKWGGLIGGVAGTLGALAVVMGVVGMALGALSPLLVIFNIALWASPITWIVLGIVGLIAVVGALIIYWDDIIDSVNELWSSFTNIGWVSSAFESFGSLVGGVVSLIVGVFNLWIEAWQKVFKWVGNLWERLGGFAGVINLVKSGVKILISVVNFLISPIKYVINLIDYFLSKFNIFKTIKQKILGVKEALSNNKDNIEESLKISQDITNKTVIDNTNNNHSVVDINVNAMGGATADSKLKKRMGGSVNLNTVDNYAL